MQGLSLKSIFFNTGKDEFARYGLELEEQLEHS